MRYYCYDVLIEPDLDTEIVKVSEDEIKDEYYPYWYDKMCNKYGKDNVDANYNFEDCLDDWIIVNDAWEVED